jgi:aminomethyltransferase
MHLTMTIVKFSFYCTSTIGKRRKQEKSFPGAEIVMKQLQEGVDRKRVGLVKTRGPPARSGAQIVNADDQIIGHVTSGCPAPSLGSSIAMGYVDSAYAKLGSDVYLKIREKMYQTTVSKMPFGPVHYCLRPTKKSS